MFDHQLFDRDKILKIKKNYQKLNNIKPHTYFFIESSQGQYLHLFQITIN
jgi:hypothetical protein